MATTSLQAEIARVRRRWLTVGGAAAALWALLAVLALALAGVWLDLVWELSPAARMAAWAVAGGGGLLLFAGLAVFAWRLGRDVLLARRLDRVRASGGEILTGLELSRRVGYAGPGSLTAGLACVAADSAAGRAAEVPSGRAVPARPLLKLASAMAGALLAVGLVGLAAPELVGTQWSRFRRPFDDVPPYSLTKLHVEPGDVSVLYGSELEVSVTVSGTPADRVELVLEAGGRSEALPMFPEGDTRWRAVLSRVTEPGQYFVRAHRARSRRYQVGVMTVPQIDDVRVRITPPAYTQQGAYEGPMPKDGVAGLPGTKVRLTARSNRPLSGGRITLTGQGPGGEVAMQPAAAGSSEAAGEFAIAGDGKFSLAVLDVQQQASQQSFAGTITLLVDHRPLIVIAQPPSLSQATPTAVLPVELLAEDDYGISRVELYRSWNDSRPLPMPIAAATPPPRRVHETLSLSLAQYGLEAGDVIKLFGRAEDNDPAGAKGAESSVVTVNIISQEDFERMVRTRLGLEALLSKYREARRRMEALAEEMEKLEKKLREELPDSLASEQTRREMKRLAERFRQEAEALRRLGNKDLPLDIEKYLSPHLKELAAQAGATAEELDQLGARRDLPAGVAAGLLKRLADRLGQQRQQFEHEVSQPLEHLELVFPLMADESRFLELAAWQEDLAQRLLAVRGREGQDDPAVAGHMRQLQREQQDLREALARWLEDVDNHVEQLPRRPEFEKLRQTATAFAAKVRGSGAQAAMSQAEAGLAEFSGTRGYENARTAADALNKLISHCRGMGSEGGTCLKFQPALNDNLGDTVSELLGAMGDGDGGGGAMGRRGALYGELPGMSGELGGGHGWNQRGGTGRGGPDGANLKAAAWTDPAATGDASGSGDAAVPLRYRRSVGRYFQQIIEDLGGSR